VHDSVVDTLRLADGALFAMPITLDVSHEEVSTKAIAPGARIALRDPRDDEVLAIITGACIVSYADYVANIPP
jgi:sulfate adenylyltransferase